ncbi:pyridoxamine 5'-phosphate oxidase family protein [Glycomyces algeriensis]|uniref:Phosphohydrolase n=1 Tax=Glycomyces algeriensis TaxID=256037 RepID=A0A9W6LIE0_9ACTN|nr:pyridoxamine 5'-phosphate oxidase family protein [Glycomyces algeriensis]MDA1365401.1 pyridoxamine 5'-phosphate oxidase family protein [Glycomyces algeriensis]MDR7351086.1 PPOX class probable FMN-dependent enzyme [Glycomyces algeriensis]GLI43799.1 phosphohydrolase [Glycomyces algeriensis]
MDSLDSHLWTEVTDPAKLREIVGEVMPQAATKERDRLHQRDREWLAASPYCVVATADAAGNCDASPKGDPAGSLVHVLDDSTLAIPERRGNHRVDGYHNVLANPHVGLLSLIPGRRETLRINGRARVVADAPFFADMVVKGHQPVLALVVEIDTIYFHCGKASMRSGIWKPETWTSDTLPRHAQLVKETQVVDATLEQLVDKYGPKYEAELY